MALKDISEFRVITKQFLLQKPNLKTVDVYGKRNGIRNGCVG